MTVNDCVVEKALHVSTKLQKVLLKADLSVGAKLLFANVIKFHPQFLSQSHWLRRKILVRPEKKKKCFLFIMFGKDVLEFLNCITKRIYLICVGLYYKLYELKHQYEDDNTNTNFKEPFILLNLVLKVTQTIYRQSQTFPKYHWSRHCGSNSNILILFSCF